MSIDEVLDTLERVLLLRELSRVEQFILRQSWRGLTYSDMARDSGYCSAHIKEVGSQLWHDLSEALGERVTKKNLQLVWSQYQKNRPDQQQSITLPQYQKNWPDQQQSMAVPEVQLNKANDFKDNFVRLVPETHIKFPGGPVPLDSPLYINRPPIEELTYAEINQPGCVVRIKAPKRMGKTSLLTRILAHGRTQGYKTVCLDFQEADAAIFASLDKFLRWFCVNVSRQLNLKPMLDEYWDEDMGSKVSCKIYFQEYLLEQIDSALVLALNEVNRVFEYPNIAQEFLPMLRFWHEQAQAVEGWQKLRLVVVHATEIYIPLKLNQSPFNVGLSIQLPQFNLEQVQDLAQRYGLNWTDNSSTEQLMAMVGGNPYMVNVALYYLCRGHITLEELLESAPTPTGVYSHHLRSYLAMLQDETQLSSALQQVVTADGSVQLEAITAYKLESMGLVQLEGNLAKPSCELYRLYFREHLRSDRELSLTTSGH